MGIKHFKTKQLVKRIRAKYGWTQEDLARKLHVTFVTVNRWERGKARAMPFLIDRLMELAGEKEKENGRVV